MLSCGSVIGGVLDLEILQIRGRGLGLVLARGLFIGTDVVAEGWQK